MNRLQTEWLRLYGHDAGAGVRALVLELARPADWSALALLWQGVQTDLALPAPAIAVNGLDGLQLWFSLAESVPEVEALGFVEALRLRYLGDVAPRRIALQPKVDAVPALREENGQWSAFVARDLAAVFSDEPWLDMCPSPEAQADVLSRLKSIKPAELRIAFELIKPSGKASPAPVAGAAAPALDPKQFLLDVMGNSSLDMHLRIEAARALLPYFEIPRSA